MANSHATCSQTLNYDNHKQKSSAYWSQTQTLSEMLNIVKNKCFDSKKNYEMSDVLAGFVVYVPNVVTPPKSTAYSFSNGAIRLSVAHPNVSSFQRQKTLIEDVTMLSSVQEKKICDDKLVVKKQLIK